VLKLESNGKEVDLTTVNANYTARTGNVFLFNHNDPALFLIGETEPIKIVDISFSYEFIDSKSLLMHMLSEQIDLKGILENEQAARRAVISELENEQAARRAVISELENEQAARRETLDELRTMERQYHVIVESTCWRATSPIRAAMRFVRGMWK
jgi:hypothetical protein